MSCEQSRGILEQGERHMVTILTSLLAAHTILQSVKHLPSVTQRQ